MATKGKLRAAASSLMGRLAAIAILILVLLIPKAMVMGLIREREDRRDEAKTEVSEKWGGEQVLLGPVLSVPYETLVVIEEKEKGVVKKTTKRQMHNAFFLPDKVVHDVQVETQVRYRGIFEIILYEAKVTTRGVFARPSFAKLAVNANRIFWDKATLVQGISDIRGIQSDVKFAWDGRTLDLSPGVVNDKVVNSGVQANVGLPEGKRQHSFEMTYTLNGAEDLRFVPNGVQTVVEMTSPWNCPSFQGAFLPKTREVRDDGFTARWEIPHLARNFPQQWQDNDITQYEMQGSAFGVSLLYPVDTYQTTMRSAKYGILFLALTFLIFFLFEILVGVKMHPIQYLLVGFGLLLFYVLLLAFSEHMLFGPAYLFASLATIGLVTAYSSSVLWNWKRARVIGVILGFTYAYLYTLLKIEDYALLLGSLGLFIALAILMFVTRNIDWYEAGDADEGKPGRKPKR